MPHHAKLRNSRILYYKTKNPFKAKFEWIFIVFSALIQHESKISVESIVLLSLNLSDVMWKTAIIIKHVFFFLIPVGGSGGSGGGGGSK